MTFAACCEVEIGLARATRRDPCCVASASSAGQAAVDLERASACRSRAPSRSGRGRRRPRRWLGLSASARLHSVLGGLELVLAQEVLREVEPRLALARCRARAWPRQQPQPENHEQSKRVTSTSSDRTPDLWARATQRAISRADIEVCIDARTRPARSHQARTIRPRRRSTPRRSRRAGDAEGRRRGHARLRRALRPLPRGRERDRAAPAGPRSTYDVRGHGQSPGARGYIDRFDTYLDDLARGARRPRATLAPGSAARPARPLARQPDHAARAVRASRRPRRPPRSCRRRTSGCGSRCPPTRSCSRGSRAASRPKLAQPNALRVEDLTHDKAEAGRARPPTSCASTSRPRAGSPSRPRRRTTSPRTPIASRCRRTWLVGGADPIADPAAEQPRRRSRCRTPTTTTSPGMQHEVFNEVDRGKVFAELITRALVGKRLNVAAIDARSIGEIRASALYSCRVGVAAVSVLDVLGIGLASQPRRRPACGASRHEALRLHVQPTSAAVGRARARARGARRAAAGQPMGPGVHRRAATCCSCARRSRARSPSISPGRSPRSRPTARSRRRCATTATALRRHRQHAAVPLPALDVRAERHAAARRRRRRACSSTSPSTCAATSRAARPASSCSTCSSRCCTTRARSTIRTCPSPSTRRALAATLQLVSAEHAKAGTTARLGNVARVERPLDGRSRASIEPLRLRRLWVIDDRGERDESFRGVLLVSGGDGDPKDGFEDVPRASRRADHARPPGPARRSRIRRRVRVSARARAPQRASSYASRSSPSSPAPPAPLAKPSSLAPPLAASIALERRRRVDALRSRARPRELALEHALRRLGAVLLVGRRRVLEDARGARLLDGATAPRSIASRRPPPDRSTTSTATVGARRA